MTKVTSYPHAFYVGPDPEAQLLYSECSVICSRDGETVYAKSKLPEHSYYWKNFPGKDFQVKVWGI